MCAARCRGSCLAQLRSLWDARLDLWLSETIRQYTPSHLQKSLGVIRVCSGRRAPAARRAQKKQLRQQTAKAQ